MIKTIKMYEESYSFKGTDLEIYNCNIDPDGFDKLNFVEVYIKRIKQLKRLNSFKHLKYTKGEEMKLTLGKALDELFEHYKYGLVHSDIKKPISWALYHTWEWANENEPIRKEEGEDEDIKKRST